jgi:cytochrome c-type biogenesis protein CcmF
MISFFILLYSYLNSDFSLINIVLYSHSLQALPYKIGALWAHNEGTIFIFCCLISFYSFIIFSFTNTFNVKYIMKVLETQLDILFLFMTMVVFNGNPFLRIVFFCLNGNQLNPLLQDIILIYHPPLLFIGYIALSLIFSLGLTLLKEYNIYNRILISIIKKISLITWVILTFGIGLGSWWAYYELGWGGWWFWDPIENIALIPWLFIIALLHNNLIIKKKMYFTHFTILLTTLPFFS